MKKILGLDLGTNSIGWALIEQNFEDKIGRIIDMGSRIIPMDSGVLGKFDSGISVSQTAERTRYRSVRKLYQRDNLRRERLHRVLNILGFLPKHYSENIDFDKNFGQFKKETKLNYKEIENGEFQFIFMDSFNEMVKEFRDVGFEGNIPYDWTIYYLRCKALERKISGEELAWVLLNFNQKRGYYQLRGEEEESDPTKLEEYHALKVLKVEETEDKNTKGIWYNIHLEGDLVYRRQSKDSLDSWIGTIKEFIITTNLDNKGNPQKDKEGNIKRSFRAVDSEKDWIAIKKKTEQDVERSNKFVGQYIFDTLLKNPKQKIKGKLIKTIERKFYKDELKNILIKQQSLHNSLRDKELYQKALDELYPRNMAHQQNIKDKDFVYLFLEDIIFYQRPLKSKKSTISNCPYETKVYIKEGQKITESLKCISKSNPIFQEFRLWQFLKNLKIYKSQGVSIDGKVEVNQDITSELLPNEESVVALFDFLNQRKEIDQTQILKYFSDLKLIPKQTKNSTDYFWNYVQDKSYPCNETKAQFLTRLSKVENVKPHEFLNDKVLQELWHIIYSVKDKKQYEKALETFAKKKNIDVNSFVEAFKKIPPYKNDYGSYSEKAIKKLLPLMRMGQYWNESNISVETKEVLLDIQTRLKSINYDKNRIDEVADDVINKPLLKSFVDSKREIVLKGLSTSQACYAIYQRHSEVSVVTKWNTASDIENYLTNVFKQHQLRNPIVEQVCTETLRLVKDIWQYHGNGEPNYFSEIHIELGREMKNPADKRKRISEQNTERENTNQRIKALLEEMALDMAYEEKPRPYSPSHQEILKIYEEGVFESRKDIDDEILKIRQSARPTKAQINKYKLWLEQGYLSPYTLAPIPLSKLFTDEYQIEHIIPQSRYFDDSMQNKIICESVINQAKDNMTAYEFINKRGGETFDLGMNRTVRLLKFDEYQAHCTSYFKKNKAKLKNLLADEIPTGFIDRQLNDTRYISKFIKGLLSNIVREEGENQATAQNVVTINGSITARLRQDWGLNDKWNELIVPRFQRLNDILNTNEFGFWDKTINAFRIQVPDEVSKGFSKKRIDHRHHALDALVIACTTKDHVNYIRSLESERTNFRLVSKLRNTKEVIRKNTKTGKEEKRIVADSYKQPWQNFTIEAKEQLEKIVVSFKQNLRVINKTNNKYWKWKKQSDGTYKKELVKQEGKNFAIRKPLHKETVSGKVLIKRKKKGLVSLNNMLNDWELIIDKKIRNQVKKLFKKYSGDLKLIKKHLKVHPIQVDGKDVNKIEVYEVVEATATRTQLSSSFSQKNLDSVTDSGIRTILQNHLNNNDNDFEKAFSPEGIELMNENIQELNGGKKHQPIYSVRLYEVGNKFAISEDLNSNKSDKYVEAAKGTNLFFVIYYDEEKQTRVYETIPLNEVIAHQKTEIGLPKSERTQMPINREKGRFLFSLSPEDLVYVPTEEEIDNPNLVDFNNLNKEQVDRIYKMVSSSNSQCFFIKNNIAQVVVNKVEFSALNKMERGINDEMIKSICWKLRIDRLGNIIKVIK